MPRLEPKNKNCYSLEKVTKNVQFGENLAEQTYTKLETNSSKPVTKCFGIDSTNRESNTHKEDKILKPVSHIQTSVCAMAQNFINSTPNYDETHQHIDVTHKTLSSSSVLKKPQEEENGNLCNTKTFVGSDWHGLKESLQFKEQPNVQTEASFENNCKENVKCTVDTEGNACDIRESFSKSPKTDLTSIPNSADKNCVAALRREKEILHSRDKHLMCSSNRESTETNVFGNSKPSTAIVENNAVSNIQHKFSNGDM